MATIVVDLTCPDHIPSDTLDCIIFIQTLQVIYGRIFGNIEEVRQIVASFSKR